MVTRAPATRRQELQGHAAMFAFSALVAGSFSFGGRIANDIDPSALTAVRFMLAATIMGLIAALAGQLTRKAFEASWRYLILGGLFAVYFILMFEGLKTAHPVSAAAVFTLTPVMAAGFGWWLMRQVTTRWMAFALAIGATGALWVIFRGRLSAFLAFDIGFGELVYFLGCIGHAIYIPMVPKLNRGEGVFAFAFGTMVGGAVFAGLLGAPQLIATQWGALSGVFWAVLGYLVVFASVASICLIQFASLRLKAAKVMAYTYLIPTWVILWEVVLAGEVLPTLMVPGVGMTILALVMLLREGATEAISAPLVDK